MAVSSHTLVPGYFIKIDAPPQPANFPKEAEPAPAAEPEPAPEESDSEDSVVIITESRGPNPSGISKLKSKGSTESRKALQEKSMNIVMAKKALS